MNPKSAPYRVAPFLLAGLLASLLLAQAAGAGPNTTGRWTGKSDTGATWNSIPVHLMLTRGTGAYHSQILWYNSHPDHEDYEEASLQGGIWGWRPDSTTSEGDCSTYPALRFTDLSHGDPAHNVFCTGHTILSNGQVLIAGGSEAETGVSTSTIFDPVTRTFATQDTMAERRWYPTTTTLPNGTALVTSGSTYSDIWSLGGQSATGTGSLVSDSLQLMLSTKYSGWGIPVKEGSTWPSARFGHSATSNTITSQTVIFGGASSGSTILSDTWFLYRGADTDAGPNYKALNWSTPTSPPERFRHSAVTPGDATTIVFGGRSLIGAKQDTWQLYDSPTVGWTWQQLSPSGTAPSLRHDHTAVWDPQNQCMLVFGGTSFSGVDGLPSDSTLHRLTLGASPAWSTVTPDSDATYGNPPSRHGHGLVFDAARRDTYYGGAPDEDHSYRFILFGGKGNRSLLNDVWVLWIPNAGSGENYMWQKVVPPGTPPSPRYRFAMKYDGSFDRLVISGGIAAGLSGDSVVATTHAVPIWHLASSNDESWVQLPAHRLGPITGHTLSPGRVNWAFGQELFDPSDGSWTSTATIKRQDWYPFGFVAPQTDSVRVFYAGPDTQSYYLNLSGSPKYWRPFPANSTPGFRSGSAVMYLPGKVMRCGSRDTDQQGGTARGMTQTLNLQAWPVPSSWSQTDTMSTGRVNHNLVILPTGHVFANGGTTTIGNAYNIGPIYRPQLWRPATGTWTSMGGADTLAASGIIRGYHSNAILLPDGRVLTTSGNPTDGEDDGDAELDAHKTTIFCPPYMFNSSGTLKTRPLISAPDSIAYGSEFNVCQEGVGTMPGITSMCLIRPAASTHGFDMDQRFIPLTFQSECSRRTLIATAPANSSIAPPGDYMLFVVKSDSMPSLASWVRVGAEDPSPPECVSCFGGEAMIAGGGDEDGTSEGEGGASPENALLAGGSGERLYRLRSDLLADSTEVVRLIQQPGGETTVDEARLISCECSSGGYVYAAGDHVVGGTLSAVSSVLSGGMVVSELTDAQEEAAVWTASSAETLSITMSSESEEVEAGGHTVIVEARRGSLDLDSQPATVTVLVPDGSGSETELATVELRRDFDEVVFEDCPATCRLALSAGTQVRRLSELIPADSVTTEVLSLSSAEHSGEGSAEAAVSDQGGSAAILAEGDTLALRWSAPSAPGSGRKQSFFLHVASGTVSSAMASNTHVGGIRPGPAFVFALYPARPNPFAGQTTIEYSLATAGEASLRIYNVAGQLVRTLLHGQHGAGPAMVVWDGRDQNGAHLGAGVYFAQLRSASAESNRKMVIVGQ